MIYFLSHPVQYFSPLFKALGKKCSLKVLYYSDVSIKGNRDKGFGTEVKWDLPLLEGYDYKFLKNWIGPKPMSNHFFDVFNPGVISELWKSKEKIVIVNGWAYSSNWLVFLFAKLFGKKIWLRAESPLNQELRKRKLILLVKKILFKYFLFKIFVDKVLYIGKQNRLFYEYYGIVNDRRFIYTPYSVDNERFSSEYTALRDQKPMLKSKYGISPEKKVILYSGKFISKKRPVDLLKAFSMLPENKFVLVFMGEGNLRAEMESFIAANKLQNVYLTGFINQGEVSNYYSIADVFVMCSGMEETWGLSVNEAMNFNLPIIVSDTTGCSSDLVTHGQNGFVYREGDIVGLVNSLKKILQDELLATSMGEKSKEIIRDYSIDIVTENIIRSL